MAKTKKPVPPKKTAKKPAKAAARKTPVNKPAKAKKVATKKGMSTAKNQQDILRDVALKALDDGKGENIVCIDVRERSSFTDFLIIATGRSNRQVNALAQSVRRKMMDAGVNNVHLEGLAQGDWGVADCGDVVVHIFRPEVRAFYRLEEVWGLEPPLHETFRKL